ncbi:antirestriction protein ArdR [Escherichia coli]|nr:antirestriction protein ArdR [Escherichia coli]
MTKAVDAANSWRAEHPEHAATGVVLVWAGQAYGWKDKLRNPEAERPGALAVDTDDHVFIAEGGNDYDGAKCWVAK